ncbi:MAG TPA: GNAT family N-acetyltransferase [Acidimicrobiales bacterium]|nr:GNAT family N-acetyltransferase [Acidimicrobiales bacterium]
MPVDTAEASGLDAPRPEDPARKPDEADAGQVDGVGIIEAARGDAEHLARVHHLSAVRAYGPILPSGGVWNFIDTWAHWREAFDDRGIRVFAAVAGEGDDPDEREWLGVVSVRMHPDFQGDGELWRLYVVPDRWRQGIGTRLHDRAMALLRDMGVPAASLWVMEKNRTARSFYEHRGWRRLADEDVADDGVRHLRYRHLL